MHNRHILELIFKILNLFSYFILKLYKMTAWLSLNRYRID